MSDKKLPAASPEIVESAKAVQETARTTGKAIDLTQNFGGFFRVVFGNLIEDTVGLAGDWMKVYRYEKLLVLQQKFQERLEARGINIADTQPLPPKVAVSLLKQASLEDDESLMDMWANLLTNALDPNCEVSANKSHTAILGQLTAAEAVLLQIIYLDTFTYPEEDEDKQKEIYAQIREIKKKGWDHLSDSIRRSAIYNLVRMRLVDYAEDMRAKNLFSFDKQNGKNYAYLGGFEYKAGFVDCESPSASHEYATIFYKMPEHVIRLNESGYLLMMACQSERPSEGLSL